MGAGTARPTLTITAWSEKFIRSRIDVDANTIRNYKTALKKVGETFGDRDPATITVDDVAGWVSELAATYKPGTVQLYHLTFRLLIDYCGVDPNPCRDPRVKLPKRVREEPNLHDPLRRLLFVTLEQGRSGSAKLSRSAGATSTEQDSGCGYHAPRRSVTVPAGCTCPSG
jgi:hypothetical protein